MKARIEDKPLVSYPTTRKTLSTRYDETPFSSTFPEKQFELNLNDEECFFHFLTHKKDLGIAMSGGGQRAATLGLGWIRAFNELGIWSKAKYVSVNSGASWINLPIQLASFKYNQSLETIIGKSQKIDADNLFEVSGSFQRALNDASMEKFLLNRSWEDAVAAYYFHVVEKDAGSSDYTHMYDQYSEQASGDETPLGPVFFLNHLKRLMHSVFGFKVKEKAPWAPLTPGAHQPLLIVNATVINSKSILGKHAFIPFEFCSAYCGVPCEPSKAVELLENADATTSIPKGFIKPYQFNVNRSYNPLSQIWSYFTIRDIITLSDISGMSSSAIVQKYYEIYNGHNNYLIRFLLTLFRLLFSFFYRGMRFYFYTISEDKKREGDLCLFADGGCVDNSAIIALLRRGVKNIIACNACNSDVVIDEENIDVNKRNENHADYMALFGKAESTNHIICGETEENYNKFRKVFDENEWENLMTEFKKKKQAGRPYIYSKENVKVLNNPYLGVEAYTVNIVFIFNANCEKWKKMVTEIKPKKGTEIRNSESIKEKFNLRAPTKKGLFSVQALQEREVDQGFPYIEVSYLNYSKILVSLLTSLTSWAITSEMVKIEDEDTFNICHYVRSSTNDD